MHCEFLSMDLNPFDPAVSQEVKDALSLWIRAFEAIESTLQTGFSCKIHKALKHSENATVEMTIKWPAIYGDTPIFTLNHWGATQTIDTNTGEHHELHARSIDQGITEILSLMRSTLDYLLVAQMGIVEKEHMKLQAQSALIKDLL